MDKKQYVKIITQVSNSVKKKQQQLFLFMFTVTLMHLPSFNNSIYLIKTILQNNPKQMEDFS